MPRPLLITWVFFGCQAATEPELDDTEAPSTPSVDTRHACPDVTFDAPGGYDLTTDVVYDIEDGEELLLDLYMPHATGTRPGVVMPAAASHAVIAATCVGPPSTTPRRALSCST